MKTIKTIIFYIFIIFVPFFLGLSYSTYNYFNTPITDHNTFFLVERGDTFKKIVKRLGNDGLIDNNPLQKKLFYYISLFINKNKINIKAGEYLITANDSPFIILKKLQ